MSVTVYQPGIIGYSEAYLLQKDIRRKVINGETGDTLLILEHPPVITIGKSGRLENVLISEAELARRGIALYFTDRGGDVTCHGPGQMVAYPIIDLKKREKNAHQYVHDLEEVAIRTLGDFSIKCCRDEAHAGIWVNNSGIAALGISLSKWVTMHGIALNVNIDLEPFSLINPCGFTDRKAVSMAELLSRDIQVAEVAEKFLHHFAEVFDAVIMQEPVKTPAGGIYG